MSNQAAGAFSMELIGEYNDDQQQVEESTEDANRQVHYQPDLE